MTGETRVSLVVGLLFIILFGLILSEVTGTGGHGALQPATGDQQPVGGSATALDRDRTPQKETAGPVRPTRPTGTVPAPPAPPRRAVRNVHTVRSGETLIGIAEKYYGRANAHQYRVILQANRDKVPNPNNLQIGTELVIPPLRGQ